MKYAICNETFQEWEWAKTCHTVAATGYDGIEIAPFTLAADVQQISQHARKVLRDTARREGLEVVGLHWLLVSPKGLSVTTSDDSVRTKTADYLLRLVHLCADMGGKILVLGSPAQRRLPNNVAPEKAVETAKARLITCLEPALIAAEQNGIILCLEPLPAPEADFILTLQQAQDILCSFPHPALKTIFDVKSACSEARPLPALIHDFAPLIAHVHANDANRRGPGFGDTDYIPVFTALKQANYTGYVSVEVFDYSPDPVTIATESLNYMRRCEALAAEGKQDVTE